MIQLAAPSATTLWINRRIAAASRSSSGTHRKPDRPTANGADSTTMRSQATIDVLMIRLATLWNVSVPEKTSPWSQNRRKLPPAATQP